MTSRAAIQSRVEVILCDLPDATLALIPTWIQEAQRELEDRHAWRVTETTATFTATEDQRLLGALPSDWNLRTDLPYVVDGLGGFTEIAWVSEAQAVRDYSDDPTNKGMPQVIVETPTEINVYPFPDATSPSGTVYSDGLWRINIPYRKRLDSLDADADENWFTDEATEYLYARAALEGLVFNRDYENAAVWSDRANRELRRLIVRDRRARLEDGFVLQPKLHSFGGGGSRRIGSR